MYYNPEPEPKKELPKFADIGDNCDYNYDCDCGNRDKLHYQWYISLQSNYQSMLFYGLILCLIYINLLF